jgi:aminoglycoside 6'-N-acetyltransferase
LDSKPVGWCQRYRWADYPADAEALGTRDGEIGIDYAIGDPAHVGRGVGTMLIATLITELRPRHPGAGILTDRLLPTWPPAVSWRRTVFSR